jgi:uncharacterized membrane protein
MMAPPFLNLPFGVQASYAAPLILMACNPISSE